MSHSYCPCHMFSFPREIGLFLCILISNYLPAHWVSGALTPNPGRRELELLGRTSRKTSVMQSAFRMAEGETEAFRI